MRSSSFRLLASTANAMDGSASFTGGKATGEALSASVSPVRVSFSLATAPISPACNSVTGRKVLPKGTPIWARRSAVSRFVLKTLISFFMTPESTLKNEIRPANGSAVVLKI